MLIIGTIKCPACSKECSSLKFWRIVFGIYFHLCEECFSKKFSEDELLIIGYLNGIEEYKKKIKDFVDKADQPEREEK